ncbi:amino acid ABC transporter permease [Rhizobium oryzicola]|uniref:Amino acid ABC transporter permease n=1 Tax=Rhizobium oryzicola TaxID=1232668 RepID=A0ABT8SVW9_9HYPH|nr:amino acid ABC transporter permease [Rhizobium oryzicola]MDO1582567.1 amino acid ABC transporter permease [Rhizobium oryzicola]
MHQVHEDQQIELNRPIPVKHYGRWLLTAFLLASAVIVASSLATNPNFHWDVVGEYLFDAQILRGVGWTLALTLVAMIFSILIAAALVIMRDSGNPVLSTLSWLWVWFFRGTPVYTQLVFWGLLSVLYPRISLELPGLGAILDLRTKDVFTPAIAAIAGLAFNESAYLAEIFRAGFKAVDGGQTEAAQALGMRRMKILCRIIIPQAMRMIIPPTGNETIGMLKTTSLVLAVPFAYDLTFAANTISNRLYLPIPLLVVAGLWYLSITSLLMWGQSYLERYFGRGIDRNQISIAPKESA